MIFAQSPTVTDVSAWEKYGLPGLLLLATITALAYLFREYVKAKNEYRTDIKEITKEGHKLTREISDQFVSLHKEQAAEAKKSEEEFRALHEKMMSRVADGGK